MPTASTPLELRLLGALRRISQYQSPETLHRRASKDWGLDDGNEAIEYAYENVISEAKAAIRGVRVKRPDPAHPARDRGGSESLSKLAAAAPLSSEVSDG